MDEFEKIYLEYFNDVFKFVLSLCRNESIAEEITQETFFNSMRNLDKFDGKCKLYVWLCQIAKNTYISYYKKQKKISTDEIDINQIALKEEDMMIKFSVWEIHKKIHELEEPYKEVFTLRVFGDLPFSQIGELFNKSDSWARLIYYRAKMRIRRDLDENTM